MKAWPIVAASALAAGLLPVAASATPVDESFSSSNVYGITGYILTPNAAVVPSGCVDLGAHYVQGVRGQAHDDFLVDCPDVVIPHINVGLFNHLELGAGDRIILGLPAGVDHDDIYANAKFRATGLRNPLQLAAGVQDFTNNVQRTVYAVGTLHVGNLVRSKMLRTVEVGGGWRFANEANPFGAAAVSAPFVNGAFGLGSAVQLMGEWSPEQQFDSNGFVCVNGTVNAGARIHIGKLGGPLKRLPGASLDIAGIGLDKNPSFSTGLTLRMCFGKKAHKKHEEEGGEEKGEEKGEPKGEAKPAAPNVNASPSIFPAHHALGLAAHLASAAQ